jgi:putative hydrolase of the HAD superfamily
LSPLPDRIGAVVFDAVGTLIHPEPPAAVVYRDIGTHFGSRLSLTTITQRFRQAFAAEEAADRADGLVTSEARERQRWQTIVAHVLDDVTDLDTCFHALFEHFARPEAWRCEAHAAETIRILSDRRYELALASNYDSRLRSVVAGLPALQPIRRLIISSEIGWRKPAPEFFVTLQSVVGQLPVRIVYIGDDRVNDYDAARAAGLQAALFDPKSLAPTDAVRIGTLTELTTLLH